MLLWMNHCMILPSIYSPIYLRTFQKDIVQFVQMFYVYTNIYANLSRVSHCLFNDQYALLVYKYLQRYNSCILFLFIKLHAGMINCIQNTLFIHTGDMHILQLAFKLENNSD